MISKRLVLTNGRILIGAYRLPDKKKIAICVQEDNEVTVCGYFANEEKADYFMHKIAETLGVEQEDNNG